MIISLTLVIVFQNCAAKIDPAAVIEMYSNSILDATVPDTMVAPGAIAMVTITLNQVAAKDVNFTFSTTDGTAIANTHYIPLSNVVGTVKGGSKSTQVQIATTNVGGVDYFQKSFAIILKFQTPAAHTTVTANVKFNSAMALVPMYQFYDGVRHLISPSSTEGPGAGYTISNGIVFNILMFPESGTRPIYRCTTSNLHFISIDAACEGMVVVGLTGYVFSTQIPGTKPLYRLYDSAKLDHVESLDPNFGASSGDIYVNEQILGYCYPP